MRPAKMVHPILNFFYKLKMENFQIALFESKFCILCLLNCSEFYSEPFGDTRTPPIHSFCFLTTDIICCPVPFAPRRLGCNGHNGVTHAEEPGTRNLYQKAGRNLHISWALCHAFLHKFFFWFKFHASNRTQLYLEQKTCMHTHKQKGLTGG